MSDFTKSIEKLNLVEKETQGTDEGPCRVGSRSVQHRPHCKPRCHGVFWYMEAILKGEFPIGKWHVSLVSFNVFLHFSGIDWVGDECQLGKLCIFQKNAAH